MAILDNSQPRAAINIESGMSAVMHSDSLYGYDRAASLASVGLATGAHDPATDPEVSGLFASLDQQIMSLSIADAKRFELLALSREMHQQVGQPGFATKQAQFMTSACDHIAALEPALSQIARFLSR
ncbi:hypothetical protein [Bordetella sp. 2513F-2]